MRQEFRRLAAFWLLSALVLGSASLPRSSEADYDEAPMPQPQVAEATQVVETSHPISFVKGSTTITPTISSGQLQPVLPLEIAATLSSESSVTALEPRPLQVELQVAGYVHVASELDLLNTYQSGLNFTTAPSAAVPYDLSPGQEQPVPVTPAPAVTSCQDCLGVFIGTECRTELKKAHPMTPFRLLVSFSEPIAAIEMANLLSPRELEVVYFVYRWGEHTGWYLPVDSSTIQESLDRFGTQHQEFLSSMILEQNSALANQTDEHYWGFPETEALRNRLANSFQEQLAYFRRDGLMLSEVVVQGEAAHLHGLVSSSLRGEHYQCYEASVPFNDDLGEPGPQSKEMLEDGKPYPDNPWVFSPERGKIRYDAGGRYFRSEFLWEDASGFTSTHRAYEHDIAIWKTKDTYVRPGSGSYYSNLPAAYVDTTLSDEYALFTIGSNWAEGIETYKLYYTQVPVELIDPSVGPADGDIQPQLGSWAGEYDDGEPPSEAQEVVFCSTTGGTNPAFCVFADQTYNLRDSYFDDVACYHKFPFDYYQTATYYWSKEFGSPNTPTLISPSNGANVPGTSVPFTWRAVIASQYNLVVATDSSFNNVVVDHYFDPPSQSGEQIQVTMYGFPDNGATYWWKVRAGHPLGWGNWSSAWDFINGPSAPPATPTLSSPSNGSNVAGTEVTFRWDFAPRAMTYQFQLSLEGDFSAEDIVMETEVSYPSGGVIITGLPDNGWDFWWRVKAGNSLGWSGWSSAWHLVNGPSAAPSTPMLSSPSNGSNVAAVTILFKWNFTPRAINCQMQVSVESGFDPEDLVLDTEVPYPYVGVYVSGFPDVGLQYWWRVRAENSLGWGDWSDSWNFVNGPSVPAEISGTVTGGATPLGLVTVSTAYKKTLTDEMGHYTLSNVHPSTYTVTAVKSGYQTSQQTVEVSEGEVLSSVDFALVSDGTEPDIEAVPLSLTFVVTESQSLGDSGSTSHALTGSQRGSTHTSGGEVPGEYVIRIRPRTTQSERANLEASVIALGAHITKRRVEPELLNLRGLVPYLVIKVPQGAPLPHSQLFKMRQVLSITPRRYCYALDEPNDPLYSGQWALPRIQAPLAWASGNGQVTPILAIVDTGIDYSHPDLAGQFGASKGYDIVDNDADPAPDTVYEYHGTHVAGIAAATTQDGLGVAGIAPATLLSVRALDEAGRGYQDDIADGINWAVSQGANIINLSLGGAADPVLEYAVQNAWDNGVLLVAAAGNEGQPGISYPAAYDEVIAVGAVTPTDDKASFSNYGPGLEVSAPGVNIVSTLPGGDYGLLDGTSMATPVIAAVAALVGSHGASLNNAEIRAILQATADDLGSPGWDEIFGYGRANAYAAVRAVLGEENVQTIEIANVGDATLEIASISESSDWLVASPAVFTVVPNASQLVNVVVDATGLEPGSYVDQLLISTNDQDESTVTVTVTLKVGAPLARFSGTVLVDGANVPDGTIISAWIGPTSYATTTTRIIEGVSRYDLIVPADDSATAEKEGGVTGDTIVFKIDDHTAEQTGVWQPTASATTLDLTAASVYSDTQSISEGDLPPITFENTNLTIDFAAACNGVVTVTMYNQDLSTPPPGNPIMSKYWDVSASCGDLTATLVFTYYESDLLGATETDIVGTARYDEQDGWLHLLGTIDTTLNTVTIPDVTEFSRWTLLNAPPPMAIADLSASESGSDLILDWSAVSQDIKGQAINGVTYLIYRAADDPYFTPGGTAYAGTSNTTLTDSGSVGNPSTNYYYAVTAVDTAGRESALSNRVGEFDFELRKTTGTDYTWIALPLHNTSLAMASDLGQHIEANCSMPVSALSIARWNGPGQQLVQYTIMPIPIGDFALQTGQAYRVESDISGADSCIWTLTGVVPRREEVSFDLVTTTGMDYSWISLPLDQGHLGMTSDLEQAIDAVSGVEVLSICRWNAIGQQLVCFTTVPVPIGDFAISGGYPYRIEVSASATWP